MEDTNLKDIAARTKRIETRVSMLAVAMGCEMVGSESTFQMTQPTGKEDVPVISSVHKHFTVMQLVKFMQSCDVRDADVQHPAGFRFSIQLD